VGKCGRGSYYEKLPEGWTLARLGEVGTTHIGLTYKPESICVHGGVPVLRSTNIQQGKLDYSDLVSVDMNIPERLYVQPGDILICARNGSRALVGKSAIVEQSGMSFGAFMAVYRSDCNPYVQLFLNSKAFRSQLDSVNTTTINQITQEMLKQIQIPLPPLTEQRHILTAVDGAFSQIDEIAANLS
jgi:type I restriction enzyme S subunit